MARSDYRIYRNRKPLKTALTVFIVLLVTLALLAVGIFFGFRKYIVYTSEGVKLEVPWLQEAEQTDTGADSADPEATSAAL